MRILVVDDERTFNLGENVTYARDAESGLYALANGKWDEVWLDHDLGDFFWDGTWLTDKIEAQAYVMGALFDVGTFVIHTANPIGRMRMAETLRKFYNVRFVRAEDYL